MTVLTGPPDAGSAARLLGTGAGLGAEAAGAGVFATYPRTAGAVDAAAACRAGDGDATGGESLSDPVR